MVSHDQRRCGRDSTTSQSRAAVLLTLGLAVSPLPILLRVLCLVRRDATTQPRNPQLWLTLVGLILSLPL
jgi:hypothetical protein